MTNKTTVNDTSVMEVLTTDVRRFLAEENLGTPVMFLAAPSGDVAKKYTAWRKKNNKPSLRQDPTTVVYTWKQEVTRKMRAVASAKANAVAKAQAAQHNVASNKPKTTATRTAKLATLDKKPAETPPPPKTTSKKTKKKPKETVERYVQPFGKPQVV